MYGEEHIILDNVFFPSTTGFRAMYPWPFGEFDYVMDDALNIAMDYLIRTGQAVQFREVQATAAHAIAVAWRLGVRSRLRLSNLAIRAVEQERKTVLEDPTPLLHNRRQPAEVAFDADEEAAD
jgi:hypothetical protein